jgi:hypothetical protein
MRYASSRDGLICELYGLDPIGAKVVIDPDIVVAAKDFFTHLQVILRPITIQAKLIVLEISGSVGSK